MKTTLKNCFTGLAATLMAAVACFTVPKASADILFAWSIANASGYGVSPLPPSANSANVTIGPLTRGSGVNTNGTNSTFTWGAEGWGLTTEAAAITANQYFTFSVTANPGYTMNLTNINIFNYQRTTNSGSGGPTNIVFQYSLDGFTFIDFKTNLIASTTKTGNFGPLALTNIPALQSVAAGTTVTFRVVGAGAQSGFGNFGVTDPTTGANDLEIRGTLADSGVAPTNLTTLSPASLTVSAGKSATFSLVAGGDQTTNFWYSIIGGITNLVTINSSVQNTNTLTLSGVIAAMNGQYYAVLSNATGTATSTVATLTVTDPSILAQPISTFGLLGSDAEFLVSAAGTSLTYQWYYAATNGTIISPVNNGQNSFSTSVNTGVTTANLVITNLTTNDIGKTYVVIVSNSFGSTITSAPATVVGASNTAPLVFWNFNDIAPTTTNNPPPYYGIGFASGIGVDVPFAGSVDPGDGLGGGFYLGSDLGNTNLSWGCSPGVAQGTSNQVTGVQFMTSTLGAHNITIQYDERASATASEYRRLLYTTNNGATWIPYPSSTTFGTPNFASPAGSSINTIGTTVQGNTGYTTSSYTTFEYDLTGFLGVDNNPQFGFRIVTEFESSGTYGASPNTNYYGVSNTYGGTGTLSYDLLVVTGTALTNGSTAVPTIAAIANTNVNDFTNVVIPITVGDSANPPSTLVMSAQSIGNNTALPPPTGVIGVNSQSGNITFSGTAPNLSMTVTPSQGNDGTQPVIVTATDPATGLSARTSFYLTVNSVNGAPTNSLINFAGTNVLVGNSITIPFSVGDDHTPANQLSYIASSANNTVVPSANITFINTNTATPSVVITPAPGQLGAAPITVTVTDNGVTINSQPNIDVRSTSATFYLQVKPNTNVVLVDYFNYDNAGALDTVPVGGTLWAHLSGGLGQAQVGTTAPGYLTLDTLHFTENLAAPLIGAPYSTNSAAVIYSSFIVNMDLLGAGTTPIVNGTFFAAFNDGTGTTANIAGRVIAATNGVATNGNYRLGISNGGIDATAAQMFPMDLVPGNNYVVVTSVVVSNNFSTIWVSPTNQSSLSVTDPTPASPRFNVGAYEFRESGTNAGAVSITKLKVGTTFDSVLPALHIKAATNGNIIVTSSDSTLPIQSTTNLLTTPFSDLAPGTPYTNTVPAATTFYRFGQ